MIGSARNTILLAILALSVTSVGCFGRSGVTGIAHADGGEGDSCAVDAHCQLQLVCIADRCQVAGQPPRQTTTNTDAGDAPDRSSTDDPVVDQAEACSLAGELTLNQWETGTTSIDATSGSCGGEGGQDEPWLLRLDAPTQVFLTTAGSSFDTVLYVRSGCDDFSPELACNDDWDGVHAALDLFLEAGSYIVYVDGFGSEGGEYRLAAETFIEP